MRLLLVGISTKLVSAIGSTLRSYCLVEGSAESVWQEEPAGNRRRPSVVRKLEDADRRSTRYSELYRDITSAEATAVGLTLRADAACVHSGNFTPASLSDSVSVRRYQLAPV
jgi:hypothetical protein